MDVRILNEKDARGVLEICLRALQENPESFGASYEEILERGVAGTVQGSGKREGTAEDVTFGAFDEKGQLGGYRGLPARVIHQAATQGRDLGYVRA